MSIAEWHRDHISLWAKARNRLRKRIFKDNKHMGPLDRLTLLEETGNRVLEIRRVPSSHTPKNFDLVADVLVFHDHQTCDIHTGNVHTDAQTGFQHAALKEEHFRSLVQAYIQEIVTRAVAIVTNESAPEVIHKDVDSISMASSNISEVADLFVKETLAEILVPGFNFTKTDQDNGDKISDQPNTVYRSRGDGAHVC